MAIDLEKELMSPAAFGGDVERVRHLQTHISHLFFAGGLVYKLKKPVDLGFLDFTTLESRRHFCEEEVRLNQRLAEGVYLGVVEIRVGADGQVRVGGDGELVDYAVAMHELPADRMLNELLDAGDLDNEKIRDLARVLVEFHGAAATGAGIDEHGSLETVRNNCRENFEQTESFTKEPRTISPLLHGFLRDRTMSFIDDHAELFEKRVTDRRIREGHGDLHSGNVCMLPDRIVAYDCIEFADRFRCCDVAADLAFLLMDLDLRCFRGFAKYLLREYVEHSGDQEMVDLVEFYKGYRAYVRFKVESMGLSGLDGQEWTRAREHAMSYAHLAASYELPPAMILFCGLPGCGKSVAAQRLSRPFEAAILNSDVTRKRQAGMPMSAHGDFAVGEGIYTTVKSVETYGELLEHAEAQLDHGRTVIVDAGFRSRAERQPFHELAAVRRVPFVIVHVDAAEDIILSRLRERERGGKSVSDAGVDVYRALVGQFEAPKEFSEHEIVTYDGESSTADLTAGLIDQLVGAAISTSGQTSN